MQHRPLPSKFGLNEKELHPGTRLHSSAQSSGVTQERYSLPSQVNRSKPSSYATWLKPQCTQAVAASVNQLCNESAVPTKVEPCKLSKVYDYQPSSLNTVFEEPEFLSLQKHSRRKVLYVKESQQLHLSFKEIQPSAHSRLSMSITDLQPLGDCTL
eukprot:TRINITY_DN789_c0_g1_i1.p3 TRINITY_DN789_c0_g1~~TRINITY_DN789_c0_g1_i1.p3  ORF type:complete len:156 (-),score=4.62 TRINITY_DN789_c0_g1_i1:182-649(-)